MQTTVCFLEAWNRAPSLKTRGPRVNAGDASPSDPGFGLQPPPAGA